MECQESEHCPDRNAEVQLTDGFAESDTTRVALWSSWCVDSLRRYRTRVLTLFPSQLGLCIRYCQDGGRSATRTAGSSVDQRVPSYLERRTVWMLGKIVSLYF